MNKLNFQYEKKEKTVAIEKETDISKIVLHNDDFNTFDWVIDSLVDICKHSTIQAEQCATLVHYKGKCEIKNGSYEDLKPMCAALLDRGLSAEIQ